MKNIEREMIDDVSLMIGDRKLKEVLFEGSNQERAALFEAFDYLKPLINKLKDLGRDFKKKDFDLPPLELVKEKAFTVLSPNKDEMELLYGLDLLMNTKGNDLEKRDTFEFIDYLCEILHNRCENLGHNLDYVKDIEKSFDISSKIISSERQDLTSYNRAIQYKLDDFQPLEHGPSLTETSAKVAGSVGLTSSLWALGGLTYSAFVQKAFLPQFSLDLFSNHVITTAFVGAAIEFTSSMRKVFKDKDLFALKQEKTIENNEEILKEAQAGLRVNLDRMPKDKFESIVNEKEDIINKYGVKIIDQVREDLKIVVNLQTKNSNSIEKE